MHLICPDCAAAYEVPTDKVRPGRRMRCANCGATWVPELTLDEPAIAAPGAESTGDEEPSAPVADAAPQPMGATALEHLAAAPALPSRRVTAGLGAAWAVSILLLLGSATATYVWRSRVVAAWPPSARLLGSVPQAGQAPGHTAEAARPFSKEVQAHEAAPPSH